MMMQRYFAIDANLSLAPNDIYHLQKVMRKQVNDQIEVVYAGVVYLCQIESITGTSVGLKVMAQLNCIAELPVEITLGLSLVSESKFNLMLQKATELGVGAIIPLMVERSVIKLTNEKQAQRLTRWKRICKEAAEQSHREVIPHVQAVTSLANINLMDYDLKLLCSPKEKNVNLKEVLSKGIDYDRIIVVIGPEGGLTIKEEENLIKQGFLRVSLGERILRVETVPIFILSIFNYLLMR